MATYKQFGNLTTAQIREIDVAMQQGRTAAQLARKYGVPAKTINEAMVMRRMRRLNREGKGMVAVRVVDLSDDFVLY